MNPPKKSSQGQPEEVVNPESLPTSLLGTLTFDARMLDNKLFTNRNPIWEISNRGDISPETVPSSMKSANAETGIGVTS